MNRLKIHLCVFGMLGLVFFSGFATAIEELLQDHRFNTASYNATGQVVIIAIDSKSLKEIATWPWPRHHHAQLIDRLKEAGVSEIAFDIDFSSKTTDAEDQAFKEALERAEGSIILPAFKQRQKTTNGYKITHTEPLKTFQDNAWLGSVGIIPGRNGHIDTMAFGHKFESGFIPSYAALLSGKYNPNAKEFYVNFSIDSKTIPVFSYVDVLKGRVNKTMLEGRKVIIGATAAELGDHLYVHAQGLIAGPMLQAIATETLLQKKDLTLLSPFAIGGLMVVIAFLLMLNAKKWNLAARLYIFPVLALIIEATSLIAQMKANLIINTSMLHLTLLAYAGVILLREIDVRKLIAQMAQLELENTRRMFEQVFKDSFSGTLIINEKGEIQAASKTAISLLKLEHLETIKGAPMQGNLPQALQTVTKQLLESTKETTPITHVTGQTALNYNAAKPLTIEYIATLSTIRSMDQKTETPTHIVSFSFKDITVEKEAKAAQEKATQAAISANKAKTEFLGTMSHELKTPLNSIIGFSNLIQISAKRSNTHPEFQEYAEEIQSGGQKLLNMVNDILTLTNIEANTVPFEERTNDPITLVERAISIVSQQNPDHNLNIVIENEAHCPHLNCDANLMIQALSEVLSNAIKFSPEGAEIKVDLSSSSEDRFTFQITDQGIGIKPEDLEKVFTPFYQKESTISRQFEGVGLGLTKAKAFMKLHQGKLCLENAPTQGLIAKLILPKHRLQHQTQSPPKPDVGAPSSEPLAMLKSA